MAEDLIDAGAVNELEELAQGCVRDNQRCQRQAIALQLEHQRATRRIHESTTKLRRLDLREAQGGARASGS